MQQVRNSIPRKLVSGIQFKVSTARCVMSFAAKMASGTTTIDGRFYRKFCEGKRFGLCRNTSRIKDTEDTKQQLYLFQKVNVYK